MLFWVAIKRDSVSLMSFPFLRQAQISLAIAPIYRLKYPFCHFSSRFSFLVFLFFYLSLFYYCCYYFLLKEIFLYSLLLLWDLADGLSLEFEWQQDPSSVQDSFQYSGRAQKRRSLDDLHSSCYFQVIQLLTLRWLNQKHQLHLVFHSSLSDSKTPQVSRTLFSILAELKNAVVWMTSTRPVISKSSSY